MKRFAVSLMIIVSSAFAFGLPDAPDVPDAQLPEIEIPGLDILDGIQVQLNELIAITDSLEWLIPDIAALDEVSAKLTELRETDPDVIGLQEELDALRGELVDARSEMAEISSAVTGDIQEVRSSLNAFMDGLPIPAE
ncbi:MAG: hypothetical protein K8S24_12010 [Candidatus Aegiribacteria sp.]|nr:hypothetical protein [Candidatus Aegiribacteria sp.]